MWELDRFLKGLGMDVFCMRRGVCGVFFGRGGWEFFNGVCGDFISAVPMSLLSSRE